MNSIWQAGENRTVYPTLQKNIRTQVLVVGGGMAGILCAKKLQAAGKDVVLVEADRIGSGITARTTAVLTAQHDTLYQDILRKFDRKTAKAYLDGNLNAVKAFREMAARIPCDFEDRPSVQFSALDPARLHREAAVVNELGFPAEFQSGLPLPMPAAGAVVYPNMAQFHPLKFLTGAAKDLNIYENSQVLNIKGTTAYLPGSTVRAEQIVVATHFPFIDRRGLFFMKLYQSRSYVLALENAPDPGMTVAELDGHGIYLRRWDDLLLLGGGDHRTGKQGGGFSYLRYYAQRYFPHARQRLAWANQDCMSLDGLPYVGLYSPNTPNLYVATGFNAWGMTGSMVAAQLITDMILSRPNPLQNILRPDRSMLHKQLFVNMGETLLDFAVPTTRRCTHLGCALRWNAAEHTWDCPCHGSRFTEDGKLLTDPAQKDL